MMLLWCSLLYLLIFMFAAYKSQICKFTFKINCTITVILFGVAFAITAYNIEPLPDAGWDLISHHRLIDEMRLVGTMHVPFANEAYNTEPLTILLHYFVSLLPSDNYFQFIAIMIEFVILSILCRGIQKEESMTGSTLCFFIILISSLCPIYQYVSGIRTVLATSFLSGALYRDLYFKKKDIFTIILYCAALSFHSFTIVIFVIRLAFFLKKIIWKCRVLFLFWGIGLVPIMTFFIKLGDIIPFFHGFSGLVRYYGRIGSLSKFASNITKYDFFRIMIVVLLTISSEMGRKYLVQNNKKGIEFISFYTVLCYFSIGSLVIYHLFDRMCIVLAWEALLTLCYLFRMPIRIYYKERNLIYFLLCFGGSVLLLFNLRHMEVFSNLVVKF